MQLTLTNNGTAPVPVHADGWAEVIPAGATSSLSYPELVWLAGDKDDILDNIAKTFDNIKNFLLHRKKPAPGDKVRLTVTNTGAKPVRVIPGDVQGEQTIQPGTNASLDGVEYIEFRELTS